MELRYLCLFLMLIALPGVLLASCPNVQTMPNFDPPRFMGRWFEIQKYPNVWEAGQKCNEANYGLNPNGTITVTNKSVFRLINYPISITGIATPNATDPAKLTVSFRQSERIVGTGKLWVLDTDYSNYALLYSCVTLPIIPINIENAWIMSRTRTLDPQIVESLKSILVAANSPTFMFFITEQSNCNNI